jgi:hypothetical protein
VGRTQNDAALTPAMLALRMIIADLVMFAGVAPAEALAAADAAASSAFWRVL